MMDNDMTSNTESAEETLYSHVPADFPRPVHLGAVTGAQEKFLMVKYNGRFYSPGCTPPEMFERWDYCESLAQQFCQKCRNNEAGKYGHLTQTQILDQYLVRLIETGWGSDQEMKWVIRRTAELAAWPAPKSAQM